MEKNVEKSFQWIIDILKKLEIPFQVSGGLAARHYGSNRELADIDIEVNDIDILKIYNEVKKYATFGPANFSDDNWDLNLLTLNHNGQEIDIAGIDNCYIFNKNTYEWEKHFIKLENWEVLFGIEVPTVSIESLMRYKFKLQRKVDLEDIKNIISNITAK